MKILSGKMTPRQRFISTASRRVTNILHGLMLLKRTAYGPLYEYTDRDVQLMFEAIRKLTSEAESAFAVKKRAEKVTFTLDRTDEKTTPQESGSNGAIHP